MPEIEELVKVLKEDIEGDVLYSELHRSLYSSGASLFRIKPMAIVQPKNKKDLVATIKFAREHGIPITARGGGTSRAGNEVGSGILVDFRKYFNKLIDINVKEKWVKVQPGIVLADLNKELKQYRLFFPIDPSTMDSATLGGMIANNSSGPHAVKYGTTRNCVQALEIVLSNGEIISTVAKSATAAETNSGDELGTRLYKEVPEILNRYAEHLEEERPHTTKNSCGYHIWDLIKDGNLDLTPLLVGSEGTLALVCEATLKLSDIPQRALSGFVYFDDLGKVGEATQEILKENASMVEIMEKHILDLARDKYPDLAQYFPENTEASLFIEFQEDREDTLLERFANVRRRLLEENHLAVRIVQAKNSQDTETFKKVRSISGPILNRMKGPKKPIAFIEDAAVHVSRLPEYISGLRKLFEKFEVKVAIYGHAGDGNLHNMAILDLRQKSDVEKMLNLADGVCDLVLSLKGTVSGEHADGRLRSYYLERQYPHLLHAMKEIKMSFDPENILNPGVIIAGEMNPLGENLKYGPDFTVTKTNSSFDREDTYTHIENCSGCAKCSSYCPIASNKLEEWTKGRGKITLYRELISGQLEAKILEDPEFREILDSCINCKRCLTECPSGVDVPWLAVAGRHEYTRRQGEGLTDRVLTDTRTLCSQGSAFAPIANLATSLAPIRWGLQKVLGMEAKRTLPTFHSRTLTKIVQGRQPRDFAREAVFFVGCYTNYNDPEGEGLAVIEVLEHNGIKVVMPEFKCCGIARISAGGQHLIMDDIQYNLDLLQPYSQKGIPIIFSEPSCALAIMKEYPRIVETEVARRVADNCYDIYQFLMELYCRGELKTDFNEIDLKVGYHAPCHLKGIGVTDEPVQLMQLIPGVEVVRYSDNCCGMGGTYGLKSKNYDLSMKIGKRLFDEINKSDVDQIVTGCGACGMQIFQGTSRESVPPVELLARAYKKEAIPEQVI